jgi:COPII coat assembly protein SEC16
MGSRMEGIILIDLGCRLTSSPEVEKAVRELLLPHAAAEGVKDGSDTFGVTASALATSTPHTTTADPNALVTYNLTIDFLRSMRQLLMQGDRQNAIRKAIDGKMWGHALLIASSVSQTVWKETVEQFIRSELRDTGAKDFESLRFFYGVLGGEGTDAVTELLPPINRMVTGVRPNTGSQAPRFGSWKESLGMVIQNQGTMDHSSAIIGLGASLVSEGRVEAGHAWYRQTLGIARLILVSC